MWLAEDEGKKKWDTGRMGWAMKKWVGEEGMGVMGLMVQLWREIAIAISWKYLRKGFRWDEEDEERVNKDEVEDMQVGYGSHVAGMIYVHGIQEQNKVVALIQEKYQ